MRFSDGEGRILRLSKTHPRTLPFSPELYAAQSPVGAHESGLELTYVGLVRECEIRAVARRSAWCVLPHRGRGSKVSGSESETRARLEGAPEYYLDSSESQRKIFIVKVTAQAATDNENYVSRDN